MDDFKHISDFDHDSVDENEFLDKVKSSEGENSIINQLSQEGYDLLKHKNIDINHYYHCQHQPDTKLIACLLLRISGPLQWMNLDYDRRKIE